MALTNCLYCSEQISENEKKCSMCGKELRISKVRICLVIFFCVLCIAIFNDIEVSAKTYNLKEGEVTPVEINVDEDEFQMIKIPFGYCNFTILITDIQVWVAGEVHPEYTQYVYVDDVYDTGKDYYARNGVISFKKNARQLDEEREFLLEMDSFKLYPEVNLTEYTIRCNISINKSSKEKLSKTNITCYLDDIDGKTVKLKNASDKIVWTISNKKVASIYREDNGVTIYPKRPGTCYLKAKCGGRSFKCKVKIKGRKYVYAGGYIKSYNTRTNTFLMKFKNCSDKVIRIKSSDATALDSDYTAYDRKVKLPRMISIKPGRTKWLKFKVVGNPTWYDVDDFCINYTVLYKGKKYRMASDTSTTWIRKKGKWKELLVFEYIGKY